MLNKHSLNKTREDYVVTPSGRQMGDFPFHDHPLIADRQGGGRHRAMAKLRGVRRTSLWSEMIWEKAKEGKMSFFVFVYVSVMNIVKYFFNLFLKYK